MALGTFWDILAIYEGIFFKFGADLKFFFLVLWLMCTGDEIGVEIRYKSSFLGHFFHFTSN